MGNIILDLHEIYNKGWKIDQALKNVFEEAISKKIREIIIIPGKGSGQLKKKVLRFLEKKEIKKLYSRVEKDSKNFGKIYVYFKF